ncbi:MAG: hypothetical protein A2Y81_00350 [Nitrospirae bacterium RBG_13_43_8]|nr:MAG: hypothetical protein A2Y81_00350 [Nitrospirae bacterium RBG_13_43_8]
MGMIIKRQGSFWPTEQQELLLRAALLKGRGAIESWKEWRSRVDIDDIDRLDPGSYRLLPLLYRNLNSQQVEDPLMMKLKGVYRLTWYKNQMLFHAIADLLRSFQNSNIETMVLKGAALTFLCYKDYGLRPMNDFDVLVHTDQAMPAIRLLQNLGWKPKDFEPHEGYISVSYSHGFEDESGREIDLHWHVFSQCRDAHADDDFWGKAVVTKFHDVPTNVLNPTDQLLHICVHGARWNETPSFRWVADAIMILNNAHNEIDWNRLAVQAEKRHLILPLLDTLHYLRDIFEAPISPEIIKNLQAVRLPHLERMEYRIAVSPPTKWIAILDLWCQYSRLKGDTTFLHKLVHFLGFLQNIWGVALWRLPFHGFSKIITWHKNPMSKRASSRIQR